jgi:hypothetical protein
VFRARQLAMFFHNGFECELLDRGIQRYQIWVHIRGRIYCRNIRAKELASWRVRAQSYCEYADCWSFIGQEPHSDNL